MSTSRLLPSGRVLRYAFHERLVHWMAGVSYAYLLLTGLAFWSPWLFWIAAALGGATVARELHPWAGLIFVVAVSLMYRTWGVEMKQTPADKAWWEAIPHYIRNEDESMPSTGRFNPGQKIVFWAFFWCGFLLLLSGVILWFTEYIPWSLRFLRYFAVIVHPVTALLTIGLFVIHVYMGTAALPGAFGAMMRGDVSRAWAKTHHRVWFEQILRSASARK